MTGRHGREHAECAGQEGCGQPGHGALPYLSVPCAVDHESRQRGEGHRHEGGCPRRREQLSEGYGGTSAGEEEEALNRLHGEAGERRVLLRELGELRIACDEECELQLLRTGARAESGEWWQDSRGEDHLTHLSGRRWRRGE